MAGVTTPAIPVPSALPLLAHLAGVSEVLAVVAHPDDESFGLGGVLAALASTGRRVRVLCLTHGEASTLGAAADLAQTRAGELACATSELDVAEALLDDWPDGQLAEQDPEALVARIEEQARSADALVAFEPSGITGHPDHQVATRLATRVADEQGLLLVEWGVPEPVAAQLRQEFNIPLAGLQPGDGVLVSTPVDRSRQWAAIGCHSSQHPDNPLLARRLELTGPREWLRLRPARYRARLARFVRRVGPLVVPDASAAQRREVLGRLVGFAAAGGLPDDVLRPDADGQYAVHCLHDDPAGWTLAAVVTDGARCTPPHDHTSWGAAATLDGVERNLSFRGSCPDQLDLLDDQLAPVGGGYLFAGGDIHQACDATGGSTVSLHLLAAGGPHAQQRCHEPERRPPGV
ncbi:MAG: PIG-L family deacetylase [Candidatus Dormibacteria bacterium]